VWHKINSTNTINNKCSIRLITKFEEPLNQPSNMYVSNENVIEQNLLNGSCDVFTEGRK